MLLPLLQNNLLTVDLVGHSRQQVNRWIPLWDERKEEVPAIAERAQTVLPVDDLALEILQKASQVKAAPISESVLIETITAIPEKQLGIEQLEIPKIAELVAQRNAEKIAQKRKNALAIMMIMAAA